MNHPHPTDAQSIITTLKPVLDMMENGRRTSIQRIQSGWKKIGLTAMVTLAVATITLMTAGSSSRTSSYSAPAHTSSPRNSGHSPVVYFIIGAIGVLTSGIIYSQYISGHKANYNAAYKKRIITAITQSMQSEMVYSHDRGISESTFKNMGLYSGNPDRYGSEDLFAGKIGKTALMFSEAHAEDKQTSTDSKGHTTTRWVTIFKGLLVIADFNKNFRSWVTIQPDIAESTFGWLGRKLQGLRSDLIRLESPDFERAFVVHGGDQVEARYLLTPDMQERLLDLRQRFGADIRIALHKSKLHLSIPNSENWFEPNIKHPAHDTAQIQNFIHQMGSVFRIVELLDLNTRIWTKE